jgi:hypothetical protein
MSLADLGRGLKLPRPTVHRLLSVLRRRGYVRQDEETQRYSLGIKMLDLSFRLLGSSELRLHAYPILRDYAVQSGQRTFLAVPGAGEVTYIWSTTAGGSPEAVMRTVYGREMPAHCSLYFGQGQASRRLSCLKLVNKRDIGGSSELVLRLGPEAGGPGLQRLYCTCAPVHDYTGREIARVGVFGHGADDKPILGIHNRGAWELARHISMRLGNVSAVAQGVA